jgi:putative colanic acid biosynthesis acetyltransferase WcaF
MRDYACLGPRTDCYNAAPVRLGEYSVVSQYAFLCTATHDISSLRLPLVTGPIELGKHAWVCADAFIGPGVAIGEGAVVGARSSAYKDVEPWTVVAGNPARFLKVRVVDR